MAWSFGDSFDLYAATADMINGYWDSATSIGGFALISPGRFTGSQSLRITSPNVNIVKSSGVNDAVHHLVLSFQQTAAISGSTLGAYFQLTDGATAQCSIVFRSDGAILLVSGASTGTVLATYTGAFTAASTWYAFEIEISINNTTGVFNVRKNGNTVNDFSATALNTRGGTANNYANKLQIGNGSTSVSNHFIDDLFWQSGAATGAWLGDIRCYARMPASDQSVTFSRTPASVVTTPFTFNANFNTAANTAQYAAITAAYNGTVSALTITTGAGWTGNLKCAVFNDAAGVPGTVLATASAPIANPVTGANTFTFSPPFSVVKGVQYWIGGCTDGVYTNGWSTASGLTGKNGAVSYAAFPVSSPTSLSNGGPILIAWTLVPGNYSLVSEAQEDGLTSYVYDSTPGDADFYGIASIASTPATVIATTTRAYMQKSDAGTRTAAVQLKSSSTTVTSTTWNPSDIANMTLTGGNLNAQPTAAGGVRSIASNTVGKYYWECAFVLAGTGEVIGASNSSAVLTTFASTGTNAAQANNLGTVAINGTNMGTGLLGAFPSNGWCGIALDAGAKLIWFRNGAAGNWNGSGTANPATGVGGFSTAAISGAIFAIAGATGSSTGVNANFGGSTFVGAVPSGFMSGFGSSTTVAAPTLTLTTSGFLWAWRMDLTDPNTGAAWTPAAVNNAQIGPTVIA